MSSFSVQPLSQEMAAPKRDASLGQKLLADFTQKVSTLENSAPPWLLPFLKEIGKEKDEVCLLQGLVQIGIRLKFESQLEAAQYLLGHLAQADIPAELRRKAEAEVAALAGKGAFGMRAEYLTSRFCEDATSYKMIVPMLAGTAAFGLVRTAAAARFASLGSSWVSKGIGFKLASAVVGSAVEIPVFAFSSRFLHQISGDAVRESVGADLLSAGLMLSVLKTFGFAESKVFEKLPQAAISPGFMFGGLLMARKLEENFGLRPQADPATTLVDTLASMLSLGVGGRLGHQILGPGYARFQRELEIRSGTQSSSPVMAPRLVEAIPVAGKGSYLQPTTRPRFAPINLMMARGPEGLGRGGAKKNDEVKAPGNSIDWAVGREPGKIQSEGLDLPYHQESLKKLAASFQAGQASVIDTLRELGWGPLWMKRNGEMERFRVTLPENPPSLYRRAIDKNGMGPETPLERNLREGFIVVPEAMGLAVRRLVEEIQSGSPLLSFETMADELPSFLFLKGSFRYRRLEALHQLLSEGRDLKGEHAVDNASGTVFDLAVTLARLGTSVSIKEPAEELSALSEGIITDGTPPEIRRRVTYLPIQDIDQPTPAGIVYWSNPDPRSLQIPLEISLEDYLSRDVKPGGYLVIQTDHFKGIHPEFLKLKLNPAEWELIFKERLLDIHQGSNYVLPTLQNLGLHLQIYRRKTQVTDHHPE